MNNANAILYHLKTALDLLIKNHSIDEAIRLGKLVHWIEQSINETALEGTDI